jgi:glycosyltransferase involved in cell wall biosynthesis
MLTDIFHNPHIGSFVEYPVNRSDINVFIYTGAIYGLRKSHYVINAFIKLLSIQPDSKLIFVGHGLPIETLSLINDKEKSKIETHPFTKDLTPYYIAATALIDIDSDLEDDVFISSKIVNYININRIIILETGHHSPSRQIFSGLNSVLQCYHDSDEIFEAMKKAIQLKHIISYNDRNEVRKLFQIEEVTQKINIVLNKIISF